MYVLLKRRSTRLSKENRIVEVTVKLDGDRTPVGLMNAEQALALPDGMDFEVSHPDDEAGATETFITRQELVEHVAAGDQ